MNWNNFEILLSLDDTKKIVKDTSGKRCFLKILSVYNRSVFAWLKKHSCPYIPAIYDWEEKEGKLWVLEEYLEGCTLTEYLKQPVPYQKREQLFYQILDGVSFLHSAKPAIIHRDIKTDNLFVTNNGTIKIIDYDAAKRFVKNEPRDTVLLGTNGYAAPEQYGFSSSDERTDIYSLGIVMREMFSDSLTMLTVANKCTKLKPEERYQSVEELKKACRGLEIRKNLNIPGFRSGKPFKMIVACLIYILLFSFVLTVKPVIDETVITGFLPLFLFRLLWFLLFFSWIDLFTHWTGFFDFFPLMKSHNLFLRILGYGIAVFITIVTALILSVIIDALFVSR